MIPHNLYIGGSFTDLGANNADRVASFEGMYVLNYNIDDSLILFNYSDGARLVYNDNINKWIFIN